LQRYPADIGRAQGETVTFSRRGFNTSTRTISDQPRSEGSRDDGFTSAVRAVVPDVVRKRYTLKFALILLIMGITVGVIGATATGMLSSEVENNVEQEYEDLATQQANAVEKWVQRNSVSVKLASKNAVLSRTDPSARYDIRRELATTGGNLYGARSTYVINRLDAGTRIVASPQFPYDVDVSQTSRHWIANVSLAEMGVADVRVTDVHDVGNGPVIAFVSPIQNAPNRYLVIEYDVNRLARSLEQGRSSRFTQVVDDEGTVQVASGSSEILRPYGSEAAMEPLRRAAALQGSGESAGVIARFGPHPEVLDEEYTVGFAPVTVQNTDLDWTVVVHQPTSEAFAFVEAISLYGRLATVAGMTFIVLIGAAIGLSTTRSINRLRYLAEQLQAGDLDVDVYSPRIDSIGELYVGFDDMRASLKRQIEEAEQAREEAEVSRAEAVQMNAYLQNKAAEYSETMRECAAGDLTRRLETDGENEAMDRIATEFNAMVEELETTTAEVKRFAEEVEEAGEVLQTSSDSVRVTSEHVADSVQAISDDAYDQKERLEAVAAEIDEVVDVLVDYADDHDDVDFEEPLTQFNEIVQQVHEVASTSQKTLAESELVAGAAEEQAAELNEVSGRAQELTRNARALGDVLDTFEVDGETGARRGEDGPRTNGDSPEPER